MLAQWWLHAQLRMKQGSWCTCADTLLCRSTHSPGLRPWLPAIVQHRPATVDLQHSGLGGTPV